MAATTPVLSLDPAITRSRHREALVLLAAAFAVPMLVHAFPVSGAVPLGARLLPLFWVAFLAAYLLRPAPAVLVAIAAPIVNHLVFGRPSADLVAQLVTEAGFMALACGWVLRRDPTFAFWAPLGYIAAKIVSLPVVMIVGAEYPSALRLATSSIANAWPGLLCLLALNLAVARHALRRGRP
jgi:hypothetical protein